MVNTLNLTLLKYRSPYYYRTTNDIAINLMRVLDKIKENIATETFIVTDFIDLRRNLKRLISFIEKIFYDSGTEDEYVKQISLKIDSLIRLISNKERRNVINTIEKGANNSIITFYLADVYDFLDLFYDVLNQTNITSLKKYKEEFSEHLSSNFIKLEEYENKNDVKFKSIRKHHFIHLQYMIPTYYTKSCRKVCWLFNDLEMIAIGRHTGTYLKKDFIKFKNHFQELIKETFKDPITDEEIINKMNNKLNYLMSFTDKEPLQFLLKSFYFLDMFYDTFEQTNVITKGPHQKMFVLLFGKMLHEYPKVDEVSKSKEAII